jgi:DNA-binding NarL/FixJ family response regulator
MKSLVRLRLPRLTVPLASFAMAKGHEELTVKVCLLSSHPLVLDRLRRLLDKSDCQICSQQLISTLAADLSTLEVPQASVYVIDSHAARLSMGALLGNILSKHENARLLVVGDGFTEADCHSMLRHGVKGILNYDDAREQLPRALPLVAAGGFWVPRAVLSRFVDTILIGTPGHRLRMNYPAELSRREQEVLTLLLDNLANKELADRLHISERTVKFHVSNVLAKFGVRRRADLILLCYQRHGDITDRTSVACAAMGFVPEAPI